MGKHYLLTFALVISIFTLVLVGIGYTIDKDGKIPITTSSDEALKYFLQGRDLFEKLRLQESLQYFEKAVAVDPNFALGHLFFAQAQPSAKGFFEQLNKAVALADKASEGERLWILGFQAGVNAFLMKQGEYYQELIKAYPNDERAHNLLGIHYFAQQEWSQAVEAFKNATKINPDFSQPYNQLGYAYRFLEDYTNAEKAFKAYIERIPDDPNPYDSYAELLMKMGKYDASIESYKQALSVNPNFVASHIGIATNLNYMGKHEAARKQLQKLYDMARNDGERRAAHFATAVSYIDEGKQEQALEELKKQYALAEKINDAAAMAGDLIAMGNILFEAGKFDKAIAKFEKALKQIEESELSQEVKDNAKRGFLFNSARVAMKKKNIAEAKAKCNEFRKQVEAINNPFQIRLSHELAGMIALEEKNYDKALAELQQANQQNPYNLYRMALAYEGKGDKEQAEAFCQKATKFNALNNLNQAFVRNKSKQILVAK